MKKVLFVLMMICTSILTNAQECSFLTLTEGEYSETDDLIAAIQGEFGSNYTLADWTDLQAIIDIDDWIACMEFAEDQTFLLTREGEHFWSGDRHYYVHYSSDGLPYPSFLAHDQIGSLYLGSWYGLNMQILAFNGTTSIHETELSGIRIYPNPVMNHLTIESLDLSKFNVKIISSSGQVLYSKEMKGKHTSMNLEGLSKGLYFIRIIDPYGQTLCAKPIIKE